MKSVAVYVNKKPAYNGKEAAIVIPQFSEAEVLKTLFKTLC